eukprot:Pgem_evm1s9931
MNTHLPRLSPLLLNYRCAQCKSSIHPITSQIHSRTYCSTVVKISRESLKLKKYRPNNNDNKDENSTTKHSSYIKNTHSNNRENNRNLVERSNKTIHSTQRDHVSRFKKSDDRRGKVTKELDSLSAFDKVNLSVHNSADARTNCNFLVSKKNTGLS